MDFYAPQFNPQPDFLKAYIQGATSNDAIQQAHQQTIIGQQQIAQTALGLQRQQAMFDFGKQQLGAQSGSGGNSGGIQNGPQSAVGQPSGYQNPVGFSGSISPGTAGALAAIRGDDPVKAMHEATQTEQEAMANEMAHRQMAARPAIALADSMLSLEHPEQVVFNNPSLRPAWNQIAPSLGLDPNDPQALTTQNVKAALTIYRNGLASQAGLPTVGVPTYFTQHPGPDGSIIQTEHGGPNSGKQDSVVGRQPVALATAGILSQGPIAALDAALSKLGITVPGAGRGGQLYAQKLQNLVNSSPGESPEQIANELRTGQIDFNGAKRSTAQLASVAASADAQTRQLEKNFNAMEPILQRMGGDGSAVLNRAFAQLSTDWKSGGDKDTAAFITYLKSTAGEYAKLNSGSTGSAPAAEGEMKDALRVMQNAYTTGGFAGVKEALLTEAHNKRSSYLEGLHNAAQTGASVGSPSDVPNASPSSGWGKAVKVNK